jgi:hypothetical protein
MTRAPRSHNDHGTFIPCELDHNKIEWQRTRDFYNPGIQMLSYILSASKDWELQFQTEMEPWWGSTSCQRNPIKPEKKQHQPSWCAWDGLVNFAQNEGR